MKEKVKNIIISFEKSILTDNNKINLIFLLYIFFKDSLFPNLNFMQLGKELTSLLSYENRNKGEVSQIGL